jgi:hypothetical protein
MAIGELKTNPTRLDLTPFISIASDNDDGRGATSIPAPTPTASEEKLVYLKALDREVDPDRRSQVREPLAIRIRHHRSCG